MAPALNDDPFAIVREAGTAAPNYDLDTEDILVHLMQWQTLCTFRITEATGDTIQIQFDTLPPDMDAFVQDLYDFCPDLVDQGTGCLDEWVAELEDSGEEIPAHIQELIEGIDFEDEHFGLEILKRELQRRQNVQLWWD